MAAPNESASASPDLPLNEELPQSKVMSNETQSFVEINVGIKPNKRTFTVHKSLTCDHSPFFHAALDGSIREAGTQVMNLVDVQPETFALFIHLLYKQYSENWHANVDSEVALRITMVDFAKLWILAKRFVMPKLQNYAMSMMSSVEAYYEFIDPKSLKTTNLTEFASYRSLKSATLAEFARYIYSDPAPNRILVRLFNDIVFFACANAEIQNIPGWKENMTRLLEDILGSSPALNLLKIVIESPVSMAQIRDFSVKNATLFIDEG